MFARFHRIRMAAQVGLTLMGCCAVTPWVQAAPLKASTLLGIVSHDPDGMLTVEGRPLQNPETDESFTLQSDTVYRLPEGDAVLLTGVITTNCPQYQWLLVTPKGFKFTAVFGTCDLYPQVYRQGQALIVAMRTQMEGMPQKIVTFELKNAKLRQVESISFWPQGFIVQ